MDVYLLLVIMYFRCTVNAATITTPSMFKRLHNVSFLNFVGYLGVEENVYSPTECSSKCKRNCYSFTYSRETKECKRYCREFHNNDRSSASLMYVKTHGDSVSDITSCSDLCPSNPTGPYNVRLALGQRYRVHCDMNTAGGPWTVIHNRQNSSIEFYRNWAAYKIGFGSLRDGNFWAGLDMIHLLTRTSPTLRIELESWHNHTRYAQYDTFTVGDENSKYIMYISGFSGSVRYDAMEFHNGSRFSTRDNDNDMWVDHCAKSHRGAWWYNNCLRCCLTGPYVTDHGDKTNSMAWTEFYAGRTRVPMKKSKMLVRHLGGV